jgi:hypothetical protein
VKVGNGLGGQGKNMAEEILAPKRRGRRKIFNLGAFTIGFLFVLLCVIVNGIIHNYCGHEDILDQYIILNPQALFLLWLGAVLQAIGSFLAGKIMGYLRGSWPRLEILLILLVLFVVIPIHINTTGEFNPRDLLLFGVNWGITLFSIMFGAFLGVREYKVMRVSVWRNNHF